jgi:hypothetical protein
MPAPPGTLSWERFHTSNEVFLELLGVLKDYSSPGEPTFRDSGRYRNLRKLLVIAQLAVVL